MPLTADTGEGHVLRCRDSLQAGLRQYTMLVDQNYPMAPQESFVRLEGDNLAFSILKRPEDLEKNTVILRVFNCSEEAASGSAVFSRTIEAAWETDLLEQKTAELPAEEKTLPIALPPRKIQTLRILLK